MGIHRRVPMALTDGIPEEKPSVGDETTDSVLNSFKQRGWHLWHLLEATRGHVGRKGAKPRKSWGGQKFQEHDSGREASLIAGLEAGHPR